MTLLATWQVSATTGKERLCLRDKRLLPGSLSNYTSPTHIGRMLTEGEERKGGIERFKERE